MANFVSVVDMHGFIQYINLERIRSIKRSADGVLKVDTGSESSISIVDEKYTNKLLKAIKMKGMNEPFD